MSEVIEKIEFMSTFGKLVTCKKDGGILVTLEIPETAKAVAGKLMLYDNKIFKVTVEVVEPDTVGGSQTEDEGEPE